jgi:single-strand DNA-binding protein
MFNKIIIVGHLGHDPELFETPTGKIYADFDVASTRRWEDGERTDWFRVIAWNRLGEVCAEYLSTGSMVLIEGRMEIDRVQEKNRTMLFPKLVAENVRFLSKAKATDEEAAPAERTQARKVTKAKAATVKKAATKAATTKKVTAKKAEKVAVDDNIPF